MTQARGADTCGDPALQAVKARRDPRDVFNHAHPCPTPTSIEPTAIRTTAVEPFVPGQGILLLTSLNSFPLGCSYRGPVGL